MERAQALAAGVTGLPGLGGAGVGFLSAELATVVTGAWWAANQADVGESS